MSEDERPLRAGIVGCGRASGEHLENICGIRGVRVVAACDPDAAKARAVAERFGVPAVFDTAAKMLAGTSLDSVHVLTPPRSHSELSIQAMEAGCHVLVEKPMAASLDEADAMLESSRRQRVVLAVCHNRLFQPAVIEAARLVRRGLLGTLVSAEIFCGLSAHDADYRNQPWVYGLPGSVFHENAPHLVYLLTAFLGPLEVISAHTRERGSHTTSDELRILLRGAGALGTVCLSPASRPYRFFLNLYGTAMSLHLDLMSNTIVRFRGEPGGRVSRGWLSVDVSLQLLSRTLTNTVRSLRGRLPTGFRTLFERFYASIREGREPPVTAEDGKRVVAVLDAAWDYLRATGQSR